MSLTESIHHSIQPNITRLAGWLAGLYIVIGVIAISPAYTRHSWEFGPFPWLLAGLGLLAALKSDNPCDHVRTAGLVVVVSLLLSPFPRPFGYMYNANIAGNVLAVIVLLVVIRGNLDWRFYALLLGLLLTGSVGSILGLLAALVVLAFQRCDFGLVVNKWVLSLIGVVGLVGMAILWAIYQIRHYYWADRLEIWSIAGQLITTPGNNALLINSIPLTYRAAPRYHLKWFIIPHAHNIFLQVGSSAGVWGLLLLSLILGLLFWRLRGPAVAFLVLWVVHGVVDCMAYEVNYYVMIISIIALHRMRSS